MIDEKKLIDDFQTLAYKERKKCDESAEMGLSDAIVKYSHGEYCYVNAIETVSSQPKIGGWIPCSERLPECEWGAETKALLYQHKGTGSIEVGYYGRGGKFRDSYFRHYRNSTDGVDSKDVIAWQPLPEAYHG